MSIAKPTRGRRTKGRRPKHIPQRTCVACREQSAKRTLTRVVRTPDGAVEIDLSGKKNGRGAYVCDRRSCWDSALSKGTLARALKTEITPTAIDEIRRYASTLPDQADNDTGGGGEVKADE